MHKIPRGYIRFRKDAVGFAMREKIKKALTVYPRPTSSYQKDVIPIYLWSEEGDYMGVPRGFFNKNLRKHIDNPVVSYSEGMNDVMANPAFPLRPGQGDVIDRCIKVMKEHEVGGVIAEMKTGSGKTPTSLEIARRLAVKTLVIVHSTVLRDQWITDGVEKFLPCARVGIVQGDRCDIRDKDIVIGMLQSLAFRDYPEEFYDEFGLIVSDECHLQGAPEFSKALPKFKARFLLGLTATLKRKDGAESVFLNNIGPIVSGMQTVKILSPNIYFIDTGMAWSPWDETMPVDRQRNHFLKSLVDSVPRNELIVRQAKKAFEAGRNVLVLSERVPQVELLARELKNRGVDVGVLTGAKKKHEREAAMKAKVICATVQLIGVGFNKPELDTLIFATPIQSIDQPVGRILRLLEGKKQPLVLDLVDSNSDTGMLFAASRRKKYRAKGWRIYGGKVFAKWDEERRERGWQRNQWR